MDCTGCGGPCTHLNLLYPPKKACFRHLPKHANTPANGYFTG